MTHGLYLYRGGARSEVLYTGTKEQCKQQIDRLSPAERLQGWTIAPLPHAFDENRRPMTRAQSFWALIGLALMTFVVVVAVLSLRGHIR